MSWYFDKEELLDTPSSRDGIDLKTETGLREEGINFIRNMGTKISLGYNTIATAVVYYHRFYMSHSFKHYPLYITACSCLFLAGKAEETPKRSKDLLKAAWELLSNDEKVIMQKFGETPRENIMRFESVLLQTINFEFDIDHPYKYLLKYAKYLKGDKSKLQTIVQMAWNFLNDSLRTTLCLEWEPEVIAIALIHVSAKLCNFKIVDWRGKKPKQTKWWDLFIEDLDIAILDDVGNQILDLYPDKNAVPVESSLMDSSSDIQTPSASSSPDESTSAIFDEPMNTSNNVLHLPGCPPVNLSVPPPGMFSTSLPVNFSIPPPINLPVPPPVNLPLPPPVNLPLLPPINLPAPPPINFPISVNLSIPPPVNFSVPPPNFSANNNFNLSSPSLTPVKLVNDKINYSCVSTSDLTFNNQLSYYTKT